MANNYSVSYIFWNSVMFLRMGLSFQEKILYLVYSNIFDMNIAFDADMTS